MLGELTNQAYNDQRDARTKRVNILRQKRKLCETNPTPTKPSQTNTQPSIILSAVSQSPVYISTVESQSKCIPSNKLFQVGEPSCFKSLTCVHCKIVQFILEVWVIRLTGGYLGNKNKDMKVSNLLLRTKLNQHLPY